MTGIGMHHMMDAYERRDLQAVRDLFAEDIDKLARAGADFFICPDNTAHMALELPGEAFPIPCLHIGEVVADRAASEGRRKVGILGTDWTMTGPVYPGALGRRDIAWAIPDEADRAYVHDVIFDELCLGTFRAEARQGYVTVIEKLAGQGCDAVALVCTEIPILISAEVSPLPILDSTRLLAAAAIDVAIGNRAMPDWRGGPL